MMQPAQQILGAHGRPLPTKRQQVMEFILAELKAERPFPGPSAVARHMEWKQHGSAADALFKLCSYDRVLTRECGSYAVTALQPLARPAPIHLPKQVEGSAISAPPKEKLMGRR